jgi:hypothetical protein
MPVSLRGANAEMAHGIESVTLTKLLRATSNLASMGRDARNITQNGPSAGSSLVPTVIVGSVLADLCAVVAFVVVGRLSHDESLSAAGLVRTGWPFVVGIVGGYIGIAMTRWPVLSFRGGVVIAVKTLVVGLVLRYGVARDDTPFAFVVVTTVVLCTLIIGWRLVALPLLRRSRVEAQADLA